ncbi:hypothetical protein [Streptomyces umbrinus]|uniref:hypothetical protein n=1 Tax=Streptomyces umbrinus TaxID=67370 RepID=UPI0033C0845C
MSADTGPAIALRGVRKVFTPPPRELHTVVIGLDPTVGGCGFTAVVAPTGRGRPTTPTLVSGLEELMECEAVVPDEPLDLRKGPCDSVVSGARALKESIARAGTGVALTAGPVTAKTEGTKTARTVSRARAARGSGSRAVVAVPRPLPLAAEPASQGTHRPKCPS